MSSHLDADTLAAYVDGRLADAELARADRHIDACGTCRRELSSLAALHTHPGEPLTATAVEAPEGMLGRYHLLRELGRGAMGIVMRAYDPELARPVAIKLLRDVDASRRELVRAEARALAKLRHPGVVTVYDVIDDGDRMYIAMELVEGDTLRGYCRGRPVGEVLAACVRAGRGLAAAHDAGVIHRDFKPENVLCTADGEARVSDFGLARAIDDAASDRAIAGTPAYMALEVLRGEPATPAADQYSFCASVYEMITGVRPDRDAPVRRDPMPAWVWRVLERGLAREPGDRHPSLRALLAALETDPRIKRRRRALLATGALAALATGAAVVHVAQPAAPSCAIDEAALGDAWNAARRADVTAAMKAAAGDDVAAKVVAALDDYAMTWVANRRDACAATRVRGEQSEAVLERRVGCLDRGRRELGELVHVLATGDAKVAAVAREAVARLRDPDACGASGDGERIGGAAPARAVIDRGRAALDRAAALEYVGKLDDADRLAEPVIAQATAFALPQLRAEALLIRARTQIDRAQHQAAETTLFDGLLAAERAHDDNLVAAIWVEIVMTTGAQEHKFDVALSNARAADAALARIEPGSDLQLRYSYSVGGMLLAHGDLAAAKQRLDAGIELAGVDPRRRAQAGLLRIARCDALRQQGKLADAHADCTKGIELLEASLGKDHLRLAVSLNTVGVLAFAEHDLATAEATYRRAIDIFERRGARDHLVYALSLSNLGAAYASRDDNEHAEQQFERARAVFEQFHPTHPQRLLPLQGLASLALRRDDAAHAIEYYEQVRDAMIATYSADSPALATVQFNLALAYRAAKQPAKAQATLDALAARTLQPGKENWTIAARALDLSATLAEERHAYPESIALRDRALAALTHTSDPATRAMIQRQVGQTYRTLHRPAEGLPALEEALAYYEANAEDDYDLGFARYALAMALWESGRDRPRALSLAKLAAADLAKAQTGELLEHYRAETAALLRHAR